MTPETSVLRVQHDPAAQRRALGELLVRNGIYANLHELQYQDAEA